MQACSLLEDDAAIRGFIARCLTEAGSIVDLAKIAERAERLVLEQAHWLQPGLPATFSS